MRFSLPNRCLLSLAMLSECNMCCAVQLVPSDVILLCTFSALLPGLLVFQPQLQVYSSTCFGFDRKVFTRLC